MLLGVALQLVVDEVEVVVLVVRSEEDTELRTLVSDGNVVAEEILERLEENAVVVWRIPSELDEVTEEMKGGVVPPVEISLEAEVVIDENSKEYVLKGYAVVEKLLEL